RADASGSGDANGSVVRTRSRADRGRRLQRRCRARADARPGAPRPPPGSRFRRDRIRRYSGKLDERAAADDACRGPARPRRLRSRWRVRNIRLTRACTRSRRSSSSCAKAAAASPDHQADFRIRPMNSQRPVDNRYALIVMTAIFFMWGFITELNDVLIPHLKAVFTLNYWQAMFVQFCFFGAYLVMAVPAGRVVARVGYKLGIVTGLLVAGGGALAILPASQAGSFVLFLPALFVLASGVVLLQASANPYVALLGAPALAPSRLNFAQAINSLGHTIGPAVGGAIIFAATALSAEQLAQLPAAQRAATVQPLYLGVA